MREEIKGIAISLGVMASVFLGLKGCNMALNNRTVIKPNYITESHSSGLYGHVEYTRYKDGSRDVKIYPPFMQGLFDSELHQDLDGNGTVDRIRKNSGSWKMNRLNELLIRENDYSPNRKRFNEADEQLKELIRMYDKDIQ
jgi:hypothetical protein